MTIENIKKMFVEKFGKSDKPLRVFKSPGRVNLIGEHTDYNSGLVFPAAICLETTIVLRERDDKIIKLAATDLDVIVEADIEKIEDYKDIPWGNYQLGVASELIKAGYDVSGCEMLYDDTVPHGGGLSSSAAIQVATAVALGTLASEKAGKSGLDMVEMALISQKSEHNYIGVKCGIMDQFASAMGKENHAVMLDCNTLEYKHVPLNLKNESIVITNTNKKRSLITSKYNERCEECAKAVEAFKTVMPEVKALAEISPEEFEKNKSVIKDDIIRNRAEHVIYEHNRVKESVKVLSEGNVEKFGELMNDSHDSLRDLYEVTGEELDTLVSAARKVDGCIGSRMTGAGFGGCTVSLVRNDAIDKFKETVEKEYTEKIGYAPSFYVTGAADGGREIK